MLSWKSPFSFSFRVFLALWAVGGLGPAAVAQGQEILPSAELRIELQRRGDSKAILKGNLTLRPADGKDAGVVLPLPADGAVLETRLPEKSTWTLSLESQDFWAPPESVTLGEAESVKQYVLSVWPLARLSGSVRMMDRGEALPREITARLSTPASGSKALAVPRVEVPCPVDEKGAWICELPAGIFDISFRAGSFVPSYRWGLVLRAGETSALGTLEMRKGASLAGWVEAEEGRIDPATCVARLSPLAGPGRMDPAAEGRLKKVFLERKVGKDGFFQIDGVAPGSYQLEIQQPGYAPARAFPLDVWEGSETLLRQALLLRRPLDIELTIEPPLDWLGKPWHVTVERKSDFSGSIEGKPAYQGPAGPDGQVKVAGQTPGRFVVQVADSQGNSLHHERDLPIGHAGEAQQVIKVDVIAVEGKITLGSEPLAATLWFGGRFGAVRVKMSSNEEGEFEGILPRSGLWRVEVRAFDPKLDSETRANVESDSKGRAEVEIRLPNTYVFGKVMDETGRPVAHARVDLGHLGGAVAVESGEAGEFDFHAFPEGRAELSAAFGSRSQGSLTSDVLMVDVLDSVPVGPMNLVLRKTRLLQGRIQSQRGPVAGAMLRVAPHSPPLGSTNRTRSELDGSFSVRVDGKAESVLAIVSPPGHVLQAFEVPVRGEPVVLNVSPDGGTLEVAMPFSMQGSEQAFFIWQNHLPLDLGALITWAEGHGTRFEDAAGLHIPRLAPGTYEVCYGPVTFSDHQELAAWKTGTATCASGFLASGATLRLSLPAKPKAVR